MWKKLGSFSKSNEEQNANVQITLGGTLEMTINHQELEYYLHATK